MLPAEMRCSGTVCTMRSNTCPIGQLSTSVTFAPKRDQSPLGPVLAPIGYELHRNRPLGSDPRLIVHRLPDSHVPRIPLTHPLDQVQRPRQRPYSQTRSLGCEREGESFGFASDNLDDLYVVGNPAGESSAHYAVTTSS